MMLAKWLVGLSCALLATFFVVCPALYQMGRATADPIEVSATATPADDDQLDDRTRIPKLAAVVDAGADKGIATSPVGEPPDPEADAGGWIRWTFDALRTKNLWLIAAAMSSLITFLLRLGVRRRVTGWLAWLNTDRGGVVLAAIVATMGGFVHAAAAGRPPGWMFLLDALQVWIGAMGIFVGLKKTMRPSA